MKEATTLENVQSILQEYKIDCASIDSESGKPTLLVYMGTDVENRELHLELSVSEASFSFKDGKEEKGIEIQQIEFLFHFPFSVKDHALFDVARAINFINSISTLPGFEYREVDEKICYRYVWMGSLDKANKWIFPSVLGIIRLIKEAYLAPLEKLSQGFVTMEDIFHNLVSISETLDNKK